jgi:hypothetical protein
MEPAARVVAAAAAMFNRSGDSAVDPELEEDAARWQDSDN